MESYGPLCVDVTDPGGALTMTDVRDRIRTYRDVLASETQIGIHAHQNLSVSVANSIIALQEGATCVDASLRGMGAGAGNTPIDALVAVMEREGIGQDADLFALLGAGEELVRPLMDRPVQVDRETLSLGYAGVYSSFLLHGQKASTRNGVDARSILVELGKRRMVGGQEDMIVDVPIDIAEGRT